MEQGPQSSFWPLRAAGHTVTLALGIVLYSLLRPFSVSCLVLAAVSVHWTNEERMATHLGAATLRES